MIPKLFAIFLVAYTSNPQATPLSIGPGGYNTFASLADCKLASALVNVELKPYYLKAQCLPVRFQKED